MVNKLQRELRNNYLRNIIGEKKRVDYFDSLEGFYELWSWAHNQDWWDRKDFLKYLRTDSLPNSIYRFLKDNENE